MRESPFLRLLMGIVGQTDECTVWRANPGTAFVPLGKSGKAVLYALIGGRQEPLIIPPGPPLAQVIDMGPHEGTGDAVGFTLTTAAGPGGQYFELETKSEEGRLRAAQVRRREHVLTNGGLYVECRPLPGDTPQQAARRSASEFFESLAIWRRS